MTTDEGEFKTEEFRKMDPEVLDLVDRWYQAYHGISVYIGTATATMFFFTMAALFQPLDAVNANVVKNAILSHENLLVWFLAFLAACLVCTLASVITTYN